MKNTIKSTLAAAAFVALSLAGPSAQAVVTYTQGDILIGFRKSVVSTDVVLNIGQAGTYRDAASNVNVVEGNLGSLLTTNFGAGWATDSALLWAVIGNPSNDGNSFSGDTSGTFYASKERTVLATPATAYSVSSSSRALVATRQQTLQSQFALQTEAGGNAFAAIWDNSVLNSAEADWTDAMTGLGRSNLAFGVFSPSQIQGGDASGLVNNRLDLFRLEAGSGTTVGVTNEGYFDIDSSGNVTFNVAAVPEPSRALLLAFGLGSLFLRRRRAARA